MTAEERARTLTGRHQISDDGRHLVDGIPFGRPYLRNPKRPAVRIPPRKRQRLIELDEDVELEASVANTTGSQPSPDMGLLTNGDTTSGPDKASRAEGASKKVHFIGEPEDEEDSEEDDEGFVPGGEPDKDAVMDDDEDEDDEDDSNFGSDSGSDSASDDSSSDSDSDSDSDDTSSDSDSDSDSDASSPPEVRSSKGVLETLNRNPPSSPKHIAPGLGRGATKRRNSRRHRTNRLRHLKDAGKLPAEAGLKELEEYDAAQASPDAPEASRPFSTFEGKRKRIDGDEVDVDSAEGLAEFIQRKKELMAKFSEDENRTTVQDEQPPQEPAATPQPVSPQEITEAEQPAEKEPPKKRLRPDTSAISRILARQAMVSGLFVQPAYVILTYIQPSVKKPSKKTPVVVEPPEPEGASDPDFWKSRISLSAFECWEEEFELSAPPYPFKQHWDPASKLMKEKADKKKKRNQKKQKAIPVEEEESEEEEKIFLDYDDTGATEDPEATSAAIEDQLRQDVETAAQENLPPLPEDITTLSDLKPGDITAGAIIVCKFFSVNPVTITPEISNYKTAIVDREGDSGHGAGTIRLKIAQRDLPKREKKFDSRGNRIYDAADQFYMEDEEEEEGLVEVMFGELLEPKLLQAA
jgi:hypothetical protein